ncbi:MAG: hypothetical protein MUF63_08060 [Rhodobacteraceae bacterium]|nr:hypothetical protein [Paracoccaceae bacterium]
MRRIALLSLVALAACQQSAPPSSGVGFSDYGSYQMAQLERDRVLTGQAPLIPPAGAVPVAGVPVAGAPLSAIPAAPVATAAVATPARDNPGISDEQNFEAVSARETIESDAERLARLSAEYQLVQPEALPERQGDTGPNIVAFALQTTNAVGQPVYRRSGFRADARFQSACARYTSADEAQRAFLERGGPEDDRMGVDPDGDGFACYWDPTPFRAARGG